MRFAVSTATGVGVGVLCWLALYPEPSLLKSTLYIIAAICWAYGGLYVNDHIVPRKDKDFHF